jgi:hypothetical protein
MPTKNTSRPIRPMSNADRYAVAKTAWNTTLAWVKNTGDSTNFNRSWDAMVGRGHDQLLAMTVMSIHRAIAIGNQEPDVGNVWDMGFDPDHTKREGFPHVGAPVAEIFVRVATTLILLWMKNEADGFYVISGDNT